MHLSFEYDFNGSEHKAPENGSTHSHLERKHEHELIHELRNTTVMPLAEWP